MCNITSMQTQLVTWYVVVPRKEHILKCGLNVENLWNQHIYYTVVWIVYITTVLSPDNSLIFVFFWHQRNTGTFAAWHITTKSCLFERVRRVIQGLFVGPRSGVLTVSAMTWKKTQTVVLMTESWSGSSRANHKSGLPKLLRFKLIHKLNGTMKDK